MLTDKFINFRLPENKRIQVVNRNGESIRTLTQPRKTAVRAYRIRPVVDSNLVACTGRPKGLRLFITETKLQQRQLKLIAEA